MTNVGKLNFITETNASLGLGLPLNGREPREVSCDHLQVEVLVPRRSSKATGRASESAERIRQVSTSLLVRRLLTSSTTIAKFPRSPTSHLSHHD